MLTYPFSSIVPISYVYGLIRSVLLFLTENPISMSIAAFQITFIFVAWLSINNSFACSVKQRKFVSFSINDDKICIKFMALLL